MCPFISDVRSWNKISALNEATDEKRLETIVLRYSFCLTLLFIGVALDDFRESVGIEASLRSACHVSRRVNGEVR